MENRDIDQTPGGSTMNQTDEQLSNELTNIVQTLRRNDWPEQRIHELVTQACNTQPATVGGGEGVSDR